MVCNLTSKQDLLLQLEREANISKRQELLKALWRLRKEESRALHDDSRQREPDTVHRSGASQYLTEALPRVG